jgi:hypothetical protein
VLLPDRLKCHQNVADYDVEHSETLLYYVHLLEEMGDPTKAIALLDTSSKSRAIVDRTAIMEFRGLSHFMRSIS